MPSVSLDIDIFGVIANETQDVLAYMLKYREDHVRNILLFLNSQTAYHEPVLKPLWASFPSDVIAFKVNDQFVIGDSIIVAPILYPNTTSRNVYLPQG